jgi:hypothetical protein
MQRFAAILDTADKELNRRIPGGIFPVAWKAVAALIFYE